MRTVLHDGESARSVGYDGSSLIGEVTKRRRLVLLRRPPSDVPAETRLSRRRKYKLPYVTFVPSPSLDMALAVPLVPTHA